MSKIGIRRERYKWLLHRHKNHIYIEAFASKTHDDVPFLRPDD